MDDGLFYDTADTSFVDRESFNSAILLLTMVKSDYYYIVGFSRPDSMIEIAFDFSGSLHGAITEIVKLDFSGCREQVVISCEMSRLSWERYERKGETISRIAGQTVTQGEIICCDDRVTYALRTPKDAVIPFSTSRLNNMILTAKNEICDFTEAYFESYLDE